MTLVKPFAITSSAATPVAWRNRPRVEKISLSSELDGERGSAQQQEDFASAKSARAQLFHNRTIETAPERPDLRLMPAFVTQVLAQITARPGADAALALPAYRSGMAKIALVYDRDA